MGTFTLTRPLQRDLHRLIGITRQATLRAARHVAKRQAEAVKDYASKGVERETLEVDVEAQRAIVGKLERSAVISNVAVIAEEDGRHCKPNDSFHFLAVIDPLDGTGSYKKGGPNYTTMVALFFAEQAERILLHPVYSLVIAPRLGDNGQQVLFEANLLRPRQAEINGSSFTSFRPRRTLKLLSAISYHSDRIPPNDTVQADVDARLNRVFGNVIDRRRKREISSFEMCATVMRRGAGVLYAKPRSNIWDVLPPLHFVEAAGGRSCFTTGEEIFPLDFESQLEFRTEDHKSFLPAGTFCGIAPAVDAVLTARK